VNKSDPRGYLTPPKSNSVILKMEAVRPSETSKQIQRKAQKRKRPPIEYVHVSE
jgi:hypothetical protein